jgi:hypothetical protein
MIVRQNVTPSVPKGPLECPKRMNHFSSGIEEYLTHDTTQGLARAGKTKNPCDIPMASFKVSSLHNISVTIPV